MVLARARLDQRTPIPSTTYRGANAVGQPATLGSPAGQAPVCPGFLLFQMSELSEAGSARSWPSPQGTPHYPGRGFTLGHSIVGNGSDPSTTQQGRAGLGGLLQDQKLCSRVPEDQSKCLFPNKDPTHDGTCGNKQTCRLESRVPHTDHPQPASRARGAG